MKTAIYKFGVPLFMVIALAAQAQDTAIEEVEPATASTSGAPSELTTEAIAMSIAGSVPQAGVEAAVAEPLSVVVTTAVPSFRMRHYFFSGIVNYKELFQVITTTSGVITDLSIKPGDIVERGAPLYQLDKNEPGYNEINVLNPFGSNSVVNIFVQKGEYVLERHLIAQLAQPLHYKIVFWMTAEEKIYLRGRKQLTVEIFPETEHVFNVRTSDVLVHAPINNNPFYKVEAVFDCETQHCPIRKLTGATARVAITDQDEDFLEIPAQAVKEGLTTVFTVDDDNRIVKHTIDLLEIDEQRAIVKNSLPRGRPLVVDFNRIPEDGETADHVTER